MRPEAYEAMRRFEDSHWWFRARRKILCDTVERYVRRGATVVDFGCGSPRTGLELISRGYRVVGVDAAAEVRDACREAQLPIVDDVRVGRRWAECVIAADVLEHTADDVQLLEQLRAALVPSGTLIVTVPAYELLWSGEDYVSEHVRRYTAQALKARLSEAGFAVVRITHFNALLLPAILMVILANRLFRPRTMYRTNLQPVSRWLNELLHTIFAAERRPLRHLRFPAGLSIMAIARPAHCPFQPYAEPAEPSPEWRPCG